MNRTSVDTQPPINQNISELTRSKLAGELILPINQQRRSPCLRKLVHWSNLLSALTSPDSIERSDREQDQDYHPTALPINQTEPEVHCSSTLGRSEPSQEQAEYDWFEHLMEEIDDSDSESDSSDGTSDQQLHLTEPVLIHIHHSTSPPSQPESRGRSRRKRTCSDVDSDRSCEARRRRLLTRSPGPRRMRPPRSRRRDSAGLGLPHWGFLCVRPEEKDKTTKTAEDEDGHLPSLVPIKARYRFESVADHPPPSSTILHPPKHTPSLVPSLDSIDFSPYDFIIAASAQLDGQIVHVKYLVGSPGQSRSSSSILHTLHQHHHHHHHHHPQYQHQQESRTPKSKYTLLSTQPPQSSARRLSTIKHPEILVTKLHIVLNHFSLPSPLPSDQHEENHLVVHSPLCPDHPNSVNNLHQILFWKVFAISNPPSF